MATHSSILAWQPTPVFLPGKFHGQRSLVDYSPWACKKSDTTDHAVILTILRLQIHEYKMLFHLLKYPLISFTDVLKYFSLYKSCTYL